jgi:hypothetical protein
MKKIIIGALAAVMATVSLASVAQAEGRDRGEDWRRDGRQHESGRHDNRRNDRWRHNGWRHEAWRHDRWRGGYWGGPRVIIQPTYYNDYCFIKKVKRYDDWGNVYVKRVRVCR